jgi:TRAP-type C4-dicarboxylate transport system substrate-binding protein
MKRALAAATAVVVVVGLAACGSPAVDKQGGKRGGDVLTLQLGAADPREPSLAYFVEQVEDLSHGRLTVEVDDTTYFSETRGGPEKLAPDLRDGAVDLAMIPSRDWAAIGDPGFVALQAPFLVDSNEASKALSTGAAAGDLLKGMAAYDGVVGLGLVAAEPRRLLTRQPVVAAEDLAGTRIRVSDSDQTMALLTAMGADPVQGMLAADVGQGLRDGSLDGVELAPTFIRDNNYQLVAPFLTSFALIPKFDALAASAQAWDRLSTEERDALSRAASATVSRIASTLDPDDQTDLAELCRTGLVIVRPASQALTGWRAAAPATPAAAAGMVDEITRALYNHGPTDDASALPTTCPVAASAGQARRMHRAAMTAPSGSTQGPRIPPGTYEARVTPQDFPDSGPGNPEFDNPITFTYVLRPDGTFRVTQHPDFPDQGPSDGRYDTDGYQVTFTSLHNDFGGTLIAPESMRWSFYDGTLTLTDVHAADDAGDAIYGVPWHLLSD